PFKWPRSPRPMNDISLIVRADSFGLCHAANQAVCEAFETGVLTCASLVVAAPWAAEAVALAREHPEWEVGLRLMLHCPTAGCRWGPVAGAGVVPSLVEAGGMFRPGLADTATEGDVVRELEAQGARARALGLTISFLECDEASRPLVGPALHR